MKERGTCMEENYNSKNQELASQNCLEHYLCTHPSANTEDHQEVRVAFSSNFQYIHECFNRKTQYPGHHCSS